jgi:hypothetical protein
MSEMSVDLQPRTLADRADELIDSLLDSVAWSPGDDGYGSRVSFECDARGLLEEALAEVRRATITELAAHVDGYCADRDMYRVHGIRPYLQAEILRFADCQPLPPAPSSFNSPPVTQ